MIANGIARLNQAIERHQNGDYAAAIRLYRAGLCLIPDHGGAWNLLAVAEARQDRLEVALEAMLRAVLCIEDPTNASAIAQNLNNLVATLLEKVSRVRVVPHNELLPLFDPVCRLVLDPALATQRAVISPELFPWAMLAAMNLGRSDLVLPIAERGVAVLENRALPITTQLIMGLLDYGVIPDRLLAAVMLPVIRLLRTDPVNKYAIYTVLYYAYYKCRTWLLGRLTRRLLGRLPDESSPILHQWRLCELHEDFFDRIEAEPPVQDTLGPMTWSPVKGNDSAPSPHFLSPAPLRPYSLVVFACCDALYFVKFGIRLVQSLAAVADDRPFLCHIHVVNPTPETVEQLQALSGSLELPLAWSLEQTTDLPEAIRTQLIQPAFLNTYFACARFLRLPELLARYGVPILTVDVDALFTASPFTMLSGMGVERYDVSIPDGTKLGPGREFFCNIVHHQGTPASRAYANLVARYIRAYFIERRPWWMLDQAALFSVHAYMVERKRPIDLNLFNVNATGAAQVLVHVMTLNQDDKERILGAITLPAVLAPSPAPATLIAAVLEAGEAEKAKDLCLQSLAANPRQGAMLYQLYRACRQLNDFEHAWPALLGAHYYGHGPEQIDTETHDFIKTLIEWLRGQVQDRAWPAAARSLIALRHFGLDAPGWSAAILQGLGEAGDIEAYQTLFVHQVLLDPAHPNAFLGLGLSDQMLGRLARGRRCMERAERLQSDPHRLRLAAVARLHEKIIDAVGPTVVTGPFAGMAYRGVSALGINVARQLGIYEAELHPTVQALVTAGYDTILNIGCAEGFYAVGMARLMPDVRVFAYDTDAVARRLCRETAQANGVDDRVTVSGLFATDMFAGFTGRRVIVLCDIEGGEDALLDGDALPALAGMDLLIEVHEGIAPGLIGRLRQRFAATHEEQFIPCVLQKQWTVALPANLTLAAMEKALALAERDVQTPWMLLTARNPTGAAS